jgi:hypothetical protein
LHSSSPPFSEHKDPDGLVGKIIKTFNYNL